MEIFLEWGYTGQATSHMLPTLFLALVSPLAAQPIVRPPPPPDTDICSYIEDVEAKTKADCTPESLAALKSDDSEITELARKRKIDVLNEYEALRAAPVAGKEPPTLVPLTPPINERTFLAWLGPESKNIYGRWLHAENRRLQQEVNNPTSLDRKREIDAAIAANQSKIAALGKLTDISALSCAIGESCGTRSALIDPSSAAGIPGKGPWTALDYKRANAQPNAQRLSDQRVLDQGIPELEPVATEALANTPLGPLAENQPQKNSSPYRTAAELALATAGGFLLFGGLGGKALEEKFPYIRRDMGIAAGVGGLVAISAVALPAILPSAKRFIKEARTLISAAETSEATGTGTLMPAPASGPSFANADANLEAARAVGKGVLIGGGVLALRSIAQHSMEPAGSGISLMARDSRRSDKERASDKPSWATDYAPRGPNESCKQYAARVAEAKYGPNYPTGPGSDYSKIKKACERGGR